MRKLVTVAIVMMIILMLIGCGGSENSDNDLGEASANILNQKNNEAINEKQFKEVTIANSWHFENLGFVTCLTPESSSNYNIEHLAVNFYESLVGYEDGIIVPEIAERWNISEDGMTYTFYIRQNETFSDGEPINAETVKLNLENIPKILGDYTAAYAYVLSIIDDIKVIDDYTLEIKFIHPYYATLLELSNNTSVIMSPRAYNDDGMYSDHVFKETLGSGPYMFGDYNGSMYTFVRNPNYTGHAPDVDVFYVKVIPDNDAKLLALRNGEIDIIIGKDNISVDSYIELGNANDFASIADSQYYTTSFLSLSSANKNFDDERVRKAMNLAIDREAICNNILMGIEEPASTLLSEFVPYSRSVNREPSTFDLEEAKALMKDAGYEDSDGDGILEKEGVAFNVDLIYAGVAGFGQSEDVFLAIQSYYKAIGIHVNLMPMDMMAYRSAGMSGDYDICASTTAPLPYEPMYILNTANTGMAYLDRFMLHEKSGNQGIGEITGLVDQEKVGAHLVNILHDVYDHYAFVPISYAREIATYNRDVIKGYAFNSIPVNMDISGIIME